MKKKLVHDSRKMKFDGEIECSRCGPGGRFARKPLISPREGKIGKVLKDY